ncbi:MAG: 7TM diverse intracellular signaling domain-containing protein [Bacteroidota bacterium]|nr:7TM diverse intracellular signaling domain-containing protein [Bacteroidota bacterium]MDP4253689.1 7TM diverse intracellular signaling domain-containing protein [Bacteroidota bacterium]
MRRSLTICLSILLPFLAHAGQGADSVQPSPTRQPSPATAPLLNYVSDHRLTLTGAVSCLIDPARTGGIPDNNGASDHLSAGIDEIRRRPFTVSFDSMQSQLNRDPRPFTFWIKFGLRNNADSALDLSLYCGNLNYVSLYFVTAGRVDQQVKAGDLRRAPPNSSYAQRRTSSLPLHIAPGVSGEVFVEIRQRTDEFDFDGLELYDEPALNALTVRYTARSNHYVIFQLLFQGLLLCQLLYVLFQWLMIRRREYLYYFFYLLVLGLYFLSKQESLFGMELLFARWPLLRIYFGKTLLALPYFLYFRFVRSFLDMAVNYPALNQWVKRVEYFLLAYLVFDLGLIFFSFNRRLQTEIFTYVLLAVFGLATSFMVYLFRRRQALVYYIISGSLAAATGNIIGLLVSYIQFNRHIDLGITDILLFAQVGIVVEMICFTAGLSYKGQAAEREKVKSQEKLIEQLKANELLQGRMQHIRNKIAQDLHDDIGSTLSSISILSGLALEERNSSHALETMNEIKDSSIMLMERMDDIVWSINPSNDSLENLLIRVKHFATTLFEAKELNYSIDIPDDIHEVRLPTDYRQHIYLVLKEAINNLVKYANATKAEIRISFDTPTVLEVSVRDDGRGFDASGQSRGNGIPGMRRRAELMNAELTVQSAPGQGTLIVLRVTIL